MQHKTSPIRIKALGDTPGTFSGYASVYNVIDSYGDSVQPGAFSKTMKDKGNKIVLLSQHDPTKPIGLGTLTDHQRGLFIEGVLELSLPAGNEAYIALKAGLISGLSIGYECVKDEFKDGVRLVREVALWEVSVCTFPANTAARVGTVKHATSGDNTVGRLQALVSEMRACRTAIKQRTVTLAATRQTLNDTIEAAPARRGHVIPINRALQALCQGAGAERRAAREKEQRDRDRRQALKHVNSASAFYKRAMRQRLDDEDQRAREHEERFDKWCAGGMDRIRKGQFTR
jgi:uncharacterized protein